MSNASDYRFRNIVTELRDCEDVIDQLISGFTDDGQPLPAEELRAVGRLLECCIDMVVLVAEEAQVRVSLDQVRESIDSVLRTANSATLTARYEARAQRLLSSM